SRILGRVHGLAGAVCLVGLFCGLVTSGFAKKLPAKPIDLNRATLAQLEELPGIGPARARAILEFRQKNGPFEHVTDLLALPGIGRKRFDRLRPYVIVVPRKKQQEKKNSPRSASNRQRNSRRR
ncbi:MAG: helix-hairpin-helix domain-containing protein, partial [Acidobacteriota bacterium]|nr:helix-hairpin-helix domain-containing protein [Acidobacteriota bacterium]